MGAHLAYIFAIKNGGHGSVLYCGPSNKAVDVVHSKKQFTCRIRTSLACSTVNTFINTVAEHNIL